MMKNEVNIFRAEDFLRSYQNNINRTCEDCAITANKLLEERLVKYYAWKDKDEDIYTISRSADVSDSHIIYGLEPQPIVKETVKREITREDLARAWNKARFNFKDEAFDDLCKELGL